MNDLINGTTRGLFRDLMTDSTVGAISTAFQDEGFAPDPDSAYQDTSIRRVTTRSTSTPSTGATGARHAGAAGV